jgi:hypothetical protein
MGGAIQRNDGGFLIHVGCSSFFFDLPLYTRIEEIFGFPKGNGIK